MNMYEHESAAHVHASTAAANSPNVSVGVEGLNK